MGFRNLFIVGMVILLAAVVSFFVVSWTKIQPITDERPGLPAVGARPSVPPAPYAITPPFTQGQILRSSPISPGSDASFGQPLLIQEFVEPILDAVGDAAREGRLPSIPNVLQTSSKLVLSAPSALPRYEDLVKPGAPFLFPPQYIHYLQAIRRIMVLNGIVSEDFYPEIRENSDAVAIMERFVDYYASLQPSSQAQRRQGLINGIRFDLRLLASEYPRGFSLPGATVVSTRAAPATPDAALNAELEALAGKIRKLKPPPPASLPPLSFCPAGRKYFIERLITSLVNPAFAQEEGGIDAEGIGEAIGAAACIIGSGTIKDCYKEKGPNPNVGSNLWAPCCDCGIPTPYGCIPIGCTNLVCVGGNAIWDPATGICGCDQF